jgi:hypothetical protein
MQGVGNCGQPPCGDGFCGASLIVDISLTFINGVGWGAGSSAVRGGSGPLIYDTMIQCPL